MLFWALAIWTGAWAIVLALALYGTWKEYYDLVEFHSKWYADTQMDVWGETAFAFIVVGALWMLPAAALFIAMVFAMRND